MNLKLVSKYIYTLEVCVYVHVCTCIITVAMAIK